MSETEIFKDIEGYEGFYQVSNEGRVRSLERVVEHSYSGIRTIKERILKPGKNRDGYLHVNLCKDGSLKMHRIHRLVAEAFTPNPENKKTINHVNGIKADNRLENIEWCTNSENQLHAYRTGLNYHADNTGKPKRSVKQIDRQTGSIIATYESIMEAEQRTGVNNSDISKCCKGNPNYHHAGGFIWIYIN